MTYKEAIKKAKAYFEAWEVIGKSRADFYRTVIEALEKAEKYKWHDLRENPNDLPEHEGRFLIIPESFVESELFVPTEAWFAYGRFWTTYGALAHQAPVREKVIAWREIEPFEEEE